MAKAPKAEQRPKPGKAKPKLNKASVAVEAKKSGAKTASKAKASEPKAKKPGAAAVKPIKVATAQNQGARPEPAAAPASKPAIDSSVLTDATALLSPEQLQALESLSLNLAKAAMTAQGAIAEAALQQAEQIGRAHV